jgi:hypothetical protein
MEKPDPVFRAGRMIGVEDNSLALLDPDLPLSQRADAELGTLQIGQNGDGTEFVFKLAKRRNIGPHILMA